MRTTLLLLLTASLLRAQTPSPQPSFALEITQDATPPLYAICGSVSESTFFSSNLHPLPDRAVDARNPSALKLTSTTADDEVELTAILAFGAIDKADTSLTLQNNPRQELGTYALHLDESVVLREMEQFGLQPWTIKIVNAQLPTPRTLPGENLVPSIRPEILGVDRQGYRIALHNISSQAVTAFAVDNSSDHNSTSIEMSFHAPLIAPGAIHEFHLFCDTTPPASADTAVPDHSTCAFFLKAALFADDSYEGNPEAAAQLLAQRVLRELQTKRVHELIDIIIADSSLDDSSKLSRIRSELPKLFDQPDDSILQQIQQRFPNLSATALNSLDSSISSTLGSQKQEVLQSLQNFSTQFAQNNSPSLSDWWIAQQSPN